jgi:hypothetical protein
LAPIAETTKPKTGMGGHVARENGGRVVAQIVEVAPQILGNFAQVRPQISHIE